MKYKVVIEQMETQGEERGIRVAEQKKKQQQQSAREEKISLHEGTEVQVNSPKGRSQLTAQEGPAWQVKIAPNQSHMENEVGIKVSALETEGNSETKQPVIIPSRKF